jgi:polyribonucleotide nucleotidyltransferase
MSDPQPQSPPQGAPSPAPQSQSPPQPAPQPPQSDDKGPVPYERFAEVNRKMRELEAKLSEREQAEQLAREQALAEQSKYKELAEARERELAELRAQQLRDRIARKYKLPDEIAARLMGDDEEALEADAAKLAELFTKRAIVPGVPPGNPRGDGNTFDLSKMSPAEIREYRKKHGYKA